MNPVICNACGCEGHKTSRSQYCLVRKENTFEVGSLVAFSFPRLIYGHRRDFERKLVPGLFWMDRQSQSHWYRVLAMLEAEHLSAPLDQCRDKEAWRNEIVPHAPFSRFNVYPARILKKTAEGYKIRMLVKLYRKFYDNSHPDTPTVISEGMENHFVELDVPVFYKAGTTPKRLLYPLTTNFPRKTLAWKRAYYNRGHANIVGTAYAPIFKNTSMRKGETAKDKAEKYKKSQMFQDECEENKKLMRKTCELPDDMFREVMEFAYPQSDFVRV